MGFEEEGTKEKSSGPGASTNPHISLQKAVDMGEYDPEFLATFPEWHTLSRHIQFQFVREGLDNRYRHLITQWAEINNVIDFHLKPHLKVALRNIERQLRKLDEDRERLYLEYST